MGVYPWVGFCLSVSLCAAGGSPDVDLPFAYAESNSDRGAGLCSPPIGFSGWTCPAGYQVAVAGEQAAAMRKLLAVLVAAVVVVGCAPPNAPIDPAVPSRAPGGPPPLRRLLVLAAFVLLVGCGEPQRGGISN